ncbi:MAG: hypothetical protein AB1717_05950 [Pseudomonadota bacterium]
MACDDNSEPTEITQEDAEHEKELIYLIKSVKGIRKWYTSLRDDEKNNAINFIHESFVLFPKEHKKMKLIDDALHAVATESIAALDAFHRLALAAKDIFELDTIPNEKKAEFAELYAKATDFSRYYKASKGHRRSYHGWRLFTETLLYKIELENERFSQKLKLTKTDLYKVTSPIFNDEYGELVSVDSIGQLLLSRKKKTGMSSR